MKSCSHCHAEFSPKRKEQTYCSNSCAAHYKGKSTIGKKLAQRLGWTYSAATTDKNGYVRMYAGNHPYANGRKMIAQHIIVMELHLKRQLAPIECVHHKNENKKDNRLENLELMTKAYHSKHHAKESAAKRVRMANGRFA